MRYPRQFMMCAVVLAMATGTLAAQDPPSRVARLNYLEGAVSFQPTGVDDWVEAGLNRPLTTGDKIWVSDRSRAELHIGSMALRLGERSDFEFLNLDDQTVQIRLSEGTMLIRLRAIAQDQLLEIDTPNLAFTVRQPGVYRIDADPDSQTTFVTVRDGAGEVTGDGQSFPLYARQRVAVRGGDQLEYNLTSAAGGDAFDEWCSGRDRREDQSQSARYVSREVPGYDDLDQYGSWVNQPEYGQVWMPASVSAGWAPYHDGHWAWIAPWGWTWVDDAPWGFAPYHYGRWASFGGRWGWIPGPYQVMPAYAPAMVAWVGGSGFSLAFSSGTAPAVGWFPLGPREPYYPSYRVSERYFTRVNTANTVINNVTINNYYRSRNDRNPRIEYVNQRVQNGVIAVPQSAFASGRRVGQFARPVTAAQVQAVHIAPGPFVVPQRTSVLGAQPDTNARSAARPPAAALSRRVVARTAPPPPTVPFDRQQAALARNAGRPLQANEVRQIRQSAPAAAQPVRVVDMSRVKRVQPAMRGEARPNPQPGTPQAPAGGGFNVPPGQQPRQDPREAQQREQLQRRQQEAERQQQRQQQEALRQQRQQQDAREAQQRQQEQEAQRQQQRQQRDAREAQQRQQQEEQRQLRQQQDAREAQQRQQQQEAQRQQQRQQQDAREAQQRQQQQEAQRQQQRQQQEAREAQQRQQQQAREAQQRQRSAPAPHPPAAPRPEPRKEQKPPAKDDKPRN
ncbi:MAG: hypothetical protein QM757_04680 [Paludibaculum sp.]